MDDFLENNSDIVIEQLAYVSASATAARYDEAYRTMETAGMVYLPAAFRREAIAIANLEGANPRRENLARLIGNRELTSIERDTKLAANIHDSLAVVQSIFDDEVPVKAISDLFMLSDTSAGRRMHADVLWSIEEGSLWLADQLASLREESNPWLAAECLRQIWTSGHFLGKQRRMAMIIAPWVLAQGFECTTPLLGLANEVRKRIDTFRHVAQSKEEWSAHLAAALTDAMKAEIGFLRDIPATKATLTALCPYERSSSSIGRAIDFMMGRPAFSAKTLAEVLKLTDRGAKVVLDRLVDADVLEIEGGLRNRLFLCRRTI